ncbi:MAG: hypothetical protein AAFV98_02945 [Chloroflexota bacterium]
MKHMMALILCLLCTAITAHSQERELIFRDATWSPDSQLIAFTIDDTIIIRDSVLNDVITLSPTSESNEQPDVNITNLTWSSDSSKLGAVVTSSGVAIQSSSLVIWETSTWQITAQFPNISLGIDFSPDNQYIATIRNQSLLVYELATSILANEVLVGDVTLFEWNPTNLNQMVILGRSQNSNYTFIDPFSGTTQNEISALYWIRPSFSPTGEYVILESHSEGILNIEVFNTSTFMSINTLGREEGFIAGLETVFWTTNTDVATSTNNGSVISWNIISDEITTFTVPESAVPVLWSPDGSMFTTYIFGSQNEGIITFSGTNGEIVSQRLETSQPYIQNTSLTDNANYSVSLSNGITINEANIQNTRITSLVGADSVGSVAFALRGSATVNEVDNIVPYELSSWTPTAGTYTLTVTPYTDNDATGTAGIPMTIAFTIEAP